MKNATFFRLVSVVFYWHVAASWPFHEHKNVKVSIPLVPVVLFTLFCDAGTFGTINILLVRGPTKWGKLVLSFSRFTYTCAAHTRYLGSLTRKTWRWAPPPPPIAASPYIVISVGDPWHFDANPDRIRGSAPPTNGSRSNSGSDSKDAKKIN